MNISYKIIDLEKSKQQKKKKLLFSLLLILLTISVFIIENESLKRYFILILLIGFILYYFKFILNNYYNEIGKLILEKCYVQLLNKKYSLNEIEKIEFYFNGYAGQNKTDRNDVTFSRLLMQSGQSRGLRNYIFIRTIENNKELVHILLNSKKEYLSIVKYINSLKEKGENKKTPDNYWDLYSLKAPLPHEPLAQRS